MTPPVAGGVFVSAKVTGVDFLTVCKEIIPFLIIGLVIIAIVTFIPEISMLLIGG
jgi:TRAP-type C4-dicarboxylate transport system permease large subunit